MEMQYGRAVFLGRAEAGDGEDQPRRYRFRASTTGLARDGGVIPAEEWRTDNFMRHPIVLDAHNYRGLGIGRATELTRDDDGLIAEIELHRLTPESISADDILAAGYPLAMSVGFLPARIEPAKAGESAIFREVDLLEVSLVAVPSDPGALQEGRMLEVSTDDTRITDLLERVGHLEALLRQTEPVAPPAVDIDLARFVRLTERAG